MGNLKILYYHLVTEEKVNYYTKNHIITPKTFEKQIKFFKSKYDVISLNEALNRYNQGYSFKNEIVITTDDGFACNYNIIAPILDKYNCKATFFINESTINNNFMIWRHILFQITNTYDRNNLNAEVNKVADKLNLRKLNKNESLLNWSLRELSVTTKDEFCKLLWQEIYGSDVEKYVYQKEIYLKDQQIIELLSNGFEIGVHSKTHPNCDMLTFDEINEEIILSKKRMENKYNTKINSFSFPFGRSKRVSDILIDLNIFDIILGINDFFPSFQKPQQWERMCCDNSYVLARYRDLMHPFTNRFRYFFKY